MIIKRITVKNFGSVGSYDVVLNSNLNILDTLFALEISIAIELVLCSKTTPKHQSISVRNDTLITAEVLLNEGNYYIELKPINGDELKLKAADVAGNDVTDFYCYTMSHSHEQDATESFDGRDKSFSSRLCWYKGCDECDAQNDLPDRTNYVVSTNTFRSYLMRYIKNFKPESINNNKNYQIHINKQGVFEVVYPGVFEKIHLSETEEKLFWYTCFLNIAEFWENIEKIRDMHHEKKPLLIKNFLEFLDQTTDINGLIVRTLQLGRQIIILTLPMQETIKMEWMDKKDEFRQIS